jgi:hypothetical protein
VQAVVQHTLSVQNPLRHWSLAVQAAPVPSWGVHLLLELQYDWEAHWLSAVQLVVQAPFEHRKGAQLCVAGEGATQTMLVQLCARVTTVALAPQVAAGQSWLPWHPHCPMALQYSGPAEDVPHMAPEWYVLVTFPLASHPYVTHTFAVGGSFGSTAFWVPPLPSHWTWWQSPGVCAGVVVVGVPFAAWAVPQRLFVHAGCWQSVVVPGQSVSAAHSTQLPAVSQ